MSDSFHLSSSDLAALAFFVIAWVLYAVALDGKVIKRVSLTSAMNAHRVLWLRNMAQREVRIVDTAIMSGLQQGCAFFASSCLIALGGCFALLGASDKVIEVMSELPLSGGVSREAFQMKVFGLVVIFAYAFFKFGWSYRLFNYCSILVGAVPIEHGTAAQNERSATAVWRATVMNIRAAKHFNAGLRSVFFSIGYLGWFINPLVLMLTTTLLVVVLIRRQFFSLARHAAVDQGPGKAESIFPDIQ